VYEIEEGAKLLIGNKEKVFVFTLCALPCELYEKEVEEFILMHIVCVLPDLISR
jgi:hypothetical protein